MPGFLSRTQKSRRNRTITPYPSGESGEATKQRLKNKLLKMRQRKLQKKKRKRNRKTTIQPKDNTDPDADIDYMTPLEMVEEYNRLRDELMLMGVPAKDILPLFGSPEEGRGKKRRKKKHNKRKTKRKTKGGHRGKSLKKKRKTKRGHRGKSPKKRAEEEVV